MGNIQTKRLEPSRQIKSVFCRLIQSHMKTCSSSKNTDSSSDFLLALKLIYFFFSKQTSFCSHKQSLSAQMTFYSVSFVHHEGQGQTKISLFNKSLLIAELVWPCCVGAWDRTQEVKLRVTKHVWCFIKKRRLKLWLESINLELSLWINQPGLRLSGNPNWRPFVWQTPKNVWFRFHRQTKRAKWS